MATSLTRAMGVLCAGLVAAGVFAQPSAPPEPHSVLVHRFSLPPGDAWATVAVKLSIDGWRVGTADGRAASVEQLGLALRDLVGIEIGGRCAGWIDGPTVYPCGFSLRNIDLAGAVAERYAAVAMDWEALNVAREVVANAARPGTQASTVDAPPRLDAERFVALRLPPRYLGDQSAALGGTLRFDLRTITNVHAPSRFDRASGMVVLRSRLRGQPS
jgi:hypothetical protein